MQDDEHSVEAMLENLLFLEARSHREEVDRLRGALDSNRKIGMAIGVLMERHGLSAEVALQALVRISRDTNRKLRDVASSFLENDILPSYPMPRGRSHGSRIADTRPP